MEGVQEHHVLVTLFSFLDGLDILKTAALVCKNWCAISKEEVVSKVEACSHQQKSLKNTQHNTTQNMRKG